MSALAPTMIKEKAMEYLSQHMTGAITLAAVLGYAPMGIITASAVTFFIPTGWNEKHRILVSEGDFFCWIFLWPVGFAIIVCALFADIPALVSLSPTAAMGALYQGIMAKRNKIEEKRTKKETK